jgi:hypothetical protein
MYIALQAGWMARLDPERVKRLLTDEDWEAMEATLREYQEGGYIAVQAGRMARLDPERVKRLLTDKDWEVMEAELRGYQEGGNGRDIALQAGDMAELARLYKDESKDTELSEDIPPLPVTRNY